MDAGRDLFAERGYDATSIADIGRRAGISKSVIYHHYGSKAGLYEAILRSEMQGLVACVAAAVSDVGDGPRLRPGIDAYLSYLESRRQAWKLLLRDPPADATLKQAHAHLTEELRAALYEVLASPGKRKTAGAQVDLAATAIRSFTSWWYDHPEVPRSEVVDAIQDVARAGARRLSAS